MRTLFFVIAIFFGMVTAASAKTLTLADVVQVDMLGYKCLTQETFDQIYPEDPNVAPLELGGKGVILPPICIPDPCAEPLTKEKVAKYFGYELKDEEWDVLYASYAEHCVAETTPFGIVGTPRAPAPDFTPSFYYLSTVTTTPDTRFTRSDVNNTFGSITFGSISVTTGDVYGDTITKVINKTVIGDCSIVDSPGSILICGDVTYIDITKVEYCDDCTPTPVPLPAGGLLLLGGLAAFAIAKKKRKEVSA